MVVRLERSSSPPISLGKVRPLEVARQATTLGFSRTVYRQENQGGHQDECT